MERYEVIRDIGSGNFGVAKLVRDVRTKELFAVKFIERGQKVVNRKSPPSSSSLPHSKIMFFPLPGDMECNPWCTRATECCWCS
jgi:serine/threonine-protein kinase SRK2